MTNAQRITEGFEMKMKWMLIICALMAAGCQKKADMPMYEQPNATQNVNANTNPRITVTQVGVFEDTLAYGDRRGVYVIKDSATGKEYIGVSGIGISETGSHSCGKACVSQDER